MVKNKLVRDEKCQNYRDKLANDLKNLRKCGYVGSDLAQTLLDKEQTKYEYIEAFCDGRKLSKEKSKEIAEKLIEKGKYGTLAKYLDKFEGLDSRIAEKLIEAGAGGKVAKNLEKFEGLDHKEIAEKLIEAGAGREVAENLYKFEGLDEEVAKMLIENGYGDAVVKYPERFGLKKGK